MSEWKYDLDEVGEDAERDAPIEPESIAVENALFLALGVLATVLVFVAIVR